MTVTGKNSRTGLTIIIASIVVLIGFAAFRQSGNESVQAAAPTCTPNQFEIVGLSVSRHWEMATLTGSVVSHCPMTAHHVAIEWRVDNGDGTFSSFPVLIDNGGGYFEPNSRYAIRSTHDIALGQPSYTVDVKAVD